MKSRWTIGFEQKEKNRIFRLSFVVGFVFFFFKIAITYISTDGLILLSERFLSPSPSICCQKRRPRG